MSEADPIPVSARHSTADHARPAVSLTELLTLAAGGGIGLVSVVALALAHLGHYSLGATALISAMLAVVAVAAVLRWDRPSIVLDVYGLIPAAVGAVVGAVYFLPGFRYSTGDRDPGVYVETGLAIARTGRLPFPDDLVQAGLPGGLGTGSQWPGLWDQSGHPAQIFPQFYHLWPALLAVTKGIGGFTGLFDTGPLVAVVSVVATVTVGRRIAGAPGAWVVAVLLPTNMLQVWQAKYPSSEIFGQLLFTAALLGVVVAIRAGWRSAAGLAGLLLSMSYLERPDGVLVVVFAWVVLCLLFAVRRFDARALFALIGLLVLLPYAWYQAYDLAKTYTLANNVPRLSTLIAGLVALAVLAVVLRPVLDRTRLLDRLDTSRTRHLLGSVFVVGCALLMLVGGLRPMLFGKAYTHYPGAGRIRSYDEISFIRMTWFFSLTGLLVMAAGIAFVAWKPWRLDRWIVGLLTTGLLTLYCYKVRNSPYLMWDFRRFVTTVVPGMVILIGCGVVGIVGLLSRLSDLRKLRARVVRPMLAVAAMALVLGLTVFQSSQSWPLHKHDENGGSIELEERLTALSGTAKGVYLWQRAGACCAAPYQLFGGPMFASMGQSSALLPQPGAGEVSAIAQYVKHFDTTGRPVFYVAAGTGSPPTVSGVRVAKVVEYAGVLPHWAETFISRPKKSVGYHYDITVYRLSSLPS